MNIWMIISRCQFPKGHLQSVLTDVHYAVPMLWRALIVIKDKQMSAISLMHIPRECICLGINTVLNSWSWETFMICKQFPLPLSSLTNWLLRLLHCDNGLLVVLLGNCGAVGNVIEPMMRMSWVRNPSQVWHSEWSWTSCYRLTKFVGYSYGR